ncbi:DUF4349 domain-containing protein [Clostridium sp. MSJ-11]|uniref:DUF4349 domain-containing protein n=1 Tax=Clostridium mobile TaxID=2841512 RepID=A0ABS6EFA3_9CLOT|nr:DUF4349 domain-containing protein [Clostridium mobile]MBU5483885.1 DUF4349 domain-containing protein [Clostridium mobile]
MKKSIKYLVGLLVILFIFTSCGSSKKSHDEYSSSVKNAETEIYNLKDNDSSISTENTKKDSSPAAEIADRKIIQNANIEIQTLNFDNSTLELSKKVESFGGYIENSNITGKRIDNDPSIENRFAEVSIRIPVKKFNEFIKDLQNLGNITNQHINTTDITSQYFDTEARLKSLKIQQERLLELLKKSGELKDMLEIERELERVGYEIETLTGTLKKWNNLIEYSTLNINLYEVQKYKKANPLSLKDKAYYGFISSVENVVYLVKLLIIFIISSIPYLITILPFILIFKYFSKNKKLNLKNLFKRNKKDI